MADCTLGASEAMRRDVIVVGSGAAGLSAALRTSELGAHVTVFTAGRVLAGSSPRAQGGVAAAVGADDTPALHAADTLSVGAGLNDRGAVSVLTREAPRSVRDLASVFAPDLGLEAGHARRRILHAGGGATGQVLTRVLAERVLADPRITVVDHAPVSSLELSTGRVTGVRYGPPGLEVTTGRNSGVRYGLRRERSGTAVILATGGYAALWGRSTNAPETRGSGLQLAWEAGAALADLEFVQFHPTALNLPGQPAFLLSEALRGEGARLVDERDREVVDPLLPRDVVARAIHRHPGQVYLSLQHLDPQRVYERFQKLAETLRGFGLDLARDPLPVAPAAHYCMGGVRTDTWGRTDVPGLYAAGEVACSGAQGANRLASNSLLECLVFGARAAEAALTDAPGTAASWTTRPLEHGGAASLRSLPPHRVPPAVQGGCRPLENPLPYWLDHDVGVERSGPRLRQLLEQLPTTELLPYLITSAALLRTESRGAHFRVDAPNTDPRWRGRIHWRRDSDPVFEEVLAAA